DAAADEAVAGPRGGPSMDYFDGGGVFGLVAGANEAGGDPGAADLVLFAELAAAAGAEQGDARVAVFDQAGGDGGGVAEAAEIESAAAECVGDEAGPGGGDHDQGAGDISPAGEGGGAVIHVHAGRHFAADLAGEERVRERRSQAEDGVERGDWKASAAEGGGGDGERGG